ncbi:hypothetical protein [Chelativorans sp. Marseille-P2723]|uniref:hypothetical protein n=1 Tax=Chelativorans sp. Marseille-P2723 TaxID=2709133 RepID=UPI00157099C0|nr:hypothetical protein [Chelativorans sp. Marseille-P2723]
MGQLTQIINDVADWADERHVDYAIFRDGGDWTLQLNFSDAKGKFIQFFPLPDRESGRLHKQLDNLCIEARKRRMQRVAYGKAGV